MTVLISRLEQRLNLLALSKQCFIIHRLLNIDKWLCLKLQGIDRDVESAPVRVSVTQPPWEGGALRPWQIRQLRQFMGERCADISEGERRPMDKQRHRNGNPTQGRAVGVCDDCMATKRDLGSCACQRNWIITVR